ncbi:DNA mismatch repair protein MutS [Amaricoccus macauensis]|uniref:DNA mismatch repair protein MutS n=1 Tax=Amaricoccus macauensis TaxID=57001 RepID=UPI003C7B505D
MTASVTPMMAQYLEIKAAHQDALLFYRMGDFYELFFQDAEAASIALDIALTKRGKHLGNDIPMCGVPVHSAEGYLLTLIRKGFRVAVCEQTEDPSEARKRGSKSVVRREVVRLVTPGTLTEESLLESRQHNYLASYAEIRGEGAIAWLDMSTGDVWAAPCPRVQLGPMLARLAPREILVSEAQESEIAPLLEDTATVATPLARSSFDSQLAEGRITTAYKVGSVEGFGTFGRHEISALGAMLDYLEMTQKGKLPLLKPPMREAPGGVMQIDAATRRNLELTRSMSGGRDGSLLAAIDRTQTGAGARLLETRLNGPSTDVAVIRERQEALALFHGNAELSRKFRDILRNVPDLERALSRLALERGGPRDLAAIRDALGEGERLIALLPEDIGGIVGAAREGLSGHDTLVELLDAALVAEPPLLARDGGFVAPGHDGELDETRKLRDEGRAVIAELQKEYVETSGVNSLKVKHNNVLGYFIETSATHSERMMSAPLNETFVHRQTTANAVRFTTLALSEIETRILNAGSHALEIEKRIFESLRGAILDRAGEIGVAAKALAELDLAAALADLSLAENWVCPDVDESRAFDVREGRHPVVEQSLRRTGEQFVSNDCDLSAGTPKARPIWLMTGPNMAGKSTFLRQNALIALLAQIGAHVPAKYARIGIVDRLFSRVGAADDLARGRSTFMVEMVETAAILNQAGERALVILDEIGRGTATYDGLSIAWAVLEHLHDRNRCRALFATHYHELTALSAKLPGLRNATVAVREWEGEVIFLHEVRDGAADRSYGIQVARLAGLPDAVIERARYVLETLEEAEREHGGKAKALVDELPLFTQFLEDRASAPRKNSGSALETRLKQIAPDELSPREALSLVYELRDLIAN